MPWNRPVSFSIPGIRTPPIGPSASTPFTSSVRLERDDTLWEIRGCDPRELARDRVDQSDRAWVRDHADASVDKAKKINRK